MLRNPNRIQGGTATLIKKLAVEIGLENIKNAKVIAIKEVGSSLK
jgi:hypothetical protein